MRTLSLILIVLAVVSCQKEPSEDSPSNAGNGNNNNNQSNDSIYLARYIEVDTTLPAGRDTTLVYTFSYDGFKRIKNVAIVDYEMPANIIHSNIDYSYQSDGDSLPYKTDEVEVESAISYRETHYFSYNGGFVSSDSSFWYDVTYNELIEKDIWLYTNSGNNTHMKTMDSVFGTNSLYTHNGTVFKTYNTDNIVQQDDTTGSTNHVTGAAHYQLSYDDKINPFYRIDIRYPVYDEQGLTVESGKNNIIEKIKGDDLLNPFHHHKYKYSYRDDGYPLTVRIIDLLDPTENRTGFFFYAK